MLPKQSFEPLKSQNWKCELGWFLLGQSQIKVFAYLKFSCIL